MAGLHHRASSVRCKPPEDTLRIAREWAPLAGIGEVIDITERDVLGLPVFISRRGGGGSESFAYGKGLQPIDAEVGAYMEAIEYHFSEPELASDHPQSEGLETSWGTPREIVGVAEDPAAVLDFCPRLGRAVELDEPMLLVEAEQLQTGQQVRLPAELAYMPAPESLGQAVYGSTTNGLASGNSVLEATVHALTELLERDVWSFEFVRRSSRRVAEEGLPEHIAEIVERAAGHGLELVIRTIVNEHELPFFAVFLFDPQRPELRWFNGGWGCHLDPSIALTRAVTEAAQSRLAYIHGGRGEPRRPSSVLSRRRDQSEREKIEAQIEMVRDARASPSFAELSGAFAAAPATLEAQLELLLARVGRVTKRPVYRLCYTKDDSPLAVIRLIAPRLEHFSDGRMRVGPRLKAAIEASAQAAAHKPKESASA